MCLVCFSSFSIPSKPCVCSLLKALKRVKFFYQKHISFHFKPLPSQTHTWHLILLHRWQNFNSLLAKPLRLLCFTIQSTALLLLISPALLTQPKLEGAKDAPHNVDDRIKGEGDGEWMRKGSEKNGESDRTRSEKAREGGEAMSPLSWHFSASLLWEWTPRYKCSTHKLEWDRRKRRRACLMCISYYRVCV